MAAAYNPGRLSVSSCMSAEGTYGQGLHLKPEGRAPNLAHCQAAHADVTPHAQYVLTMHTVEKRKLVFCL